MSDEHLSADATTIFEALEDAGLEPGAINFTCYRGRTRHPIKLPALAAGTAGTRPRRADALLLLQPLRVGRTGAPLAIRSRPAGSIDAYAAAVGRWLVTRDGFDFLVFYLPDYDYASHLARPRARSRGARASGRERRRLLGAAGGPEAFLERYAIVVCSDHGQTRVDRREPGAARRSVGLHGTARDEPGGRRRRRHGVEPFRHGLPRSRARLDARALAERLDGSRRPTSSLFLEDGEAVARREGEELRFAPESGGWRTRGDERVLDPARYPNGLERAWYALACSERGRRARLGRARSREFADLGGRHHAGGGSHGSLVAGDSMVPDHRRRVRRARRCPPDPSDHRPRPARARALRRRAARVDAAAHVRRRVPDLDAQRDRMVAEQLERARDRGRARARRRWRVCRARRSSTRGDRRRAYEDIPIGSASGQTISQPYMVALICQAAEVRGRRARARRGHRLRLPGRRSRRAGRRGAHGRADPELAERARENARRGRLPTGSTVHVGDGSPRRFRSRRRSTRSPSPLRRRSCRRPLYDQLAPGGRLVVPVGDRRGQRLEVIVRSPEGPAVARSVPCRFVPLVGEEGF